MCDAYCRKGRGEIDEMVESARRRETRYYADTDTHLFAALDSFGGLQVECPTHSSDPPIRPKFLPTSVKERSYFLISSIEGVPDPAPCLLFNWVGQRSARRRSRTLKSLNPTP